MLIPGLILVVLGVINLDSRPLTGLLLLVLGIIVCNA